MLQQARRAIDAGRPDEAQRIALDCLKNRPADLEATKILGYALLMQDKAAEAIGPLEKAARSNRDAEVETELAIALRKTGAIDKALIWLNRAVKRSPPFVSAFHELGYVLFELGRLDEAKSALKQGLAMAPMMVEMAIQLGFVCYAANDRANAGGAFAHALSINPVHPEAIQGLATVLMDDGDFARAAELYRRRVAADANDALARIGLGKCLLELGDAQGGYACLKAATAREPAAYANILQATISSAHGRFWLRPSAAARFFKSGG